jgi:hypothetical protein
MANQYPWGTASYDLVNASQISNTRKQSNWLHSIIAGAAMLAVGSLGVVLIFDWYFFSVIDGLSSSLRPIASVIRHADGDTATNAGNARHRRERREQADTKEFMAHSWLFESSGAAAKTITDESAQPRNGDQAGSLFAPVHSAADSKTPAN